MFKEAIEACLTGKLWDKARSIVAESAPQFNDYVEKSHQKFMLALETAGVKDLGGMNAVSH
jgi:hypothetical protein